MFDVNISKYKKIRELNNINEIHNFISKLVKGYSYKKINLRWVKLSSKITTCRNCGSKSLKVYFPWEN